MIINNIANLRKKKNMTQQELANEINISRQTLISIEDNKSNISLELAFKFADYFQLSIEDIFIDREKYMFSKKLSAIDKIKEEYGKNTIIIKDNLVFRCSTEVLEIGPQCILSYELPAYGKMKKFVIVNDKVYELIPTRDYENRNDRVLHKVGNQVDIDYSKINFDETTAHNYKDI